MEKASIFSPYRIPEGCKLDSSLGATPERSNNGFYTLNPYYICIDFYYFSLRSQILRKAIYSSITSNLTRRTCMERLHIYPGSEIPENIKSNINGQIRPLRPVPKPLQQYSQQEIDLFPKIFDYPKDYIVRWRKSKFIVGFPNLLINLFTVPPCVQFINGINV